MKRKFVAAIWSRNTNQFNQTEDLGTRLFRLRAAVKRSAEIVTSRGMREDPQGIFLAPEYLFAEPVHAVGPRRRHSYTTGAGGQQRRHVDQATKDWILTQLKELSRREGANLLLVPGTIAWYKPLPDVKQALDIVARAHARGIGQAGPSKSLEYDPVANTWVPSRAPIPMTATHGWKLRRLNSLAVIEQPKLLHSYAQANGITDDEARQRRNNALEARNTAYVLYNGDEIFVYDKQGDFHEVLDYDANRRNIYIPGVKDGVFTRWGIKFGIEICLDHAIQALKGHHGDESPHVHLISSAAVGVDSESLVIKRGGVALHACCDKSESGVWRRTTVRGEIKECTRASDDYVKFLGAEDVKGAELQTYEINLDCWS